MQYYVTLDNFQNGDNNEVLQEEKDEDDVENLDALLEKLGLQEYAPAFQKEQIDLETLVGRANPCDTIPTIPPSVACWSSVVTCTSSDTQHSTDTRPTLDTR